MSDIAWIVTRVAVDDLPKLREMHLVRGHTVLNESDDQLMVVTADGTAVEYCGPSYPVPGYMFATQTSVVGYRSTDLDGDAVRLRGAGAVLLGRGDGGGVNYLHYSHGGLVSALISTSDR